MPRSYMRNPGEKVSTQGWVFGVDGGVRGPGFGRESSAFRALSFAEGYSRGGGEGPNLIAIRTRGALLCRHLHSRRDAGRSRPLSTVAPRVLKLREILADRIPCFLVFKCPGGDANYSRLQNSGGGG